MVGKKIKKFFKKTGREISIVAVLLGTWSSLTVIAAQTVPTTPTVDKPIQTFTKEELEQQLLNRGQQLDQINAQLEETKQNLKTTQNQKVTLQQQLNVIKNNISILNLNIKGDAITVEKLALEVQKLQTGIEDIKKSISEKKAGIEAGLQQLQKSERTNLLATVLGSGSLADALNQTQGIKNIQNQLSIDIEGLSSLYNAYNEKLDETSDKKQKITFHKKDLENRKIIVQDQQQDQQRLLKETKNQESTFQKQLTELEKQQQDIAAEIENLDALLRLKIDNKSIPTFGSGVLALPLKGDKSLVTQGYGATTFAKYGYRGKWHNGIDLGSPVGTPLYAAEEGRVVATGDQDRYCYRGAYGKFITISHNNNLTTLYGHLSRIIVSAGETVTRGQLIGYVGKTGYATGPHLHLTVFASQTFYMGQSKSCGIMPYGGDLNPLNYL